MARSRPPLPDDRYHRHPHLTTLVVCLIAGGFIGALVALGSTVAGGVLVTLGAGLAFAAFAELLSLLVGLPLVPYAITGLGITDRQLDGGTAGAGAWLVGSGDGGGGGGDGGGGGG